MPASPILPDAVDPSSSCRISTPTRRSAERIGSTSRSKPSSSKQLADCRAELGVRPAGGDQLLQHPHIAGVQVVLEEVAGLLVALPQRRVLGVHAPLAVQAALVLLLEQGQDQTLLGAKVVVQLTDRHPGLLSHLAGRQPSIAVGQESAPRRVKDERVGVQGRGSGIRHGRASSPDPGPTVRSIARSVLTIHYYAATIS